VTGVVLLACAGCGQRAVLRTTPASSGVQERTIRVRIPPAPTPPAPAPPPSLSPRAPAPGTPPAPGKSHVGELRRVRPGMHAAVVACLLAAPQNRAGGEPPLGIDWSALPPGTEVIIEERSARGEGIAVDVRGSEADLSKFNTQAPTAEVQGASASGGGARMIASALGASEGQVALYLVGAALLAGGLIACKWWPGVGARIALAGGVILVCAFLMETAPWVFWLAGLALLVAVAVVVLHLRRERFAADGVGQELRRVEQLPAEEREAFKLDVADKVGVHTPLRRELDRLVERAGA
jgi:hypothetical protein